MALPLTRHQALILLTAKRECPQSTVASPKTSFFKPWGSKESIKNCIISYRFVVALVPVEDDP